MTQPQDKMRAEFEAWAEHSFYSGMDSPELDWSDESNSYKTLGHQMAFCAWQAACAQQSAQSQQDALDAARWRAVTHQPGLEEIFLCKFGICEGLDEDLYGEEAEQEVDAAMAAQGASNV